MLEYNVWDTINCNVSHIRGTACSDKFKVTAERENYKLAVLKLLSPHSPHYWHLTRDSHGSSQSCLCEHAPPRRGGLPALGAANARQDQEMQPLSCFPLPLFFPSLPCVNSPLDYVGVHSPMIFGIHLQQFCQVQL